MDTDTVLNLLNLLVSLILGLAPAVAALLHIWDFYRTRRRQAEIARGKIRDSRRATRAS